MLFTSTIEDGKSWANISQQIDTFKPLIHKIFERKSIPCGSITSTGWSTNAVFRVGNTAIKIFAPKESGHDTARDYPSELFGQARALSLGVPAPKILASGVAKDKYDFPYIVTEWIDGVDIRKAFHKMDADEKHALGRKLREIADVLNTPCEPFNHIHYPSTVISAGYNSWLEDLGYQKSFLADRMRHIQSLRIQQSDLVFCHGDLVPANILQNADGTLHTIDFASSLLAPICVELSYMTFFFSFDKSFINGFFGETPMHELVDMCLNGFLLSVNGISLLANGLDFGFIDGTACESVADFRMQLQTYIKKKSCIYTN